MNVSAIIVTRGNVDLAPCWAMMPDEWEKIAWDNSKVNDVSVYGRYAAIELATHDLIYVQDDDVIVSDPQAIVDTWFAEIHPPSVDHYLGDELISSYQPPGRECLVANMPQEFRHDGYTDSCLVGFGACYHRDLPHIAFGKFWEKSGWLSHFIAGLNDAAEEMKPEFLRTCDVVFTTLTPRVLVDVPKVDREFASDPNRMWKQPNHVGERSRMLELARQVRDA